MLFPTLRPKRSPAQSQPPSREESFDAFAQGLRARKDTGERLFEAAKAAGLAPSSRNRYGESLLEAAARLGSEGACLAMLRDGADPFAPARCVDEAGLLARLRPFEAFVAHDMPLAIHRAARELPPSELAAEELRWIGAQAGTHAQLRLWRLGGGWVHLASAAGALRSLRALAALGVGLRARDGTGSGPLMAAARSRGSNAACAEALMTMGADPWEANDEGERAADFMPQSWLALRAHEEARQIAMHCQAGAQERSSGGARSL